VVGKGGPPAPLTPARETANFFSKNLVKFLSPSEVAGNAMIILVLFVVTMFLWFLTNLPVPQAQQFGWAGGWLAFIAVLLLGIFLFVPGLRV
jgi:hypothetical protein